MKNQWGGVISVHLHLYDIVYQNSCNVSVNLFNLNIFSVIFAPHLLMLLPGANFVFQQRNAAEVYEQ